MVKNTRHTCLNLDMTRDMKDFKIAPGGEVSFRYSDGVILEVDKYIYI